MEKLNLQDHKSKVIIYLNLPFLTGSRKNTFDGRVIFGSHYNRLFRYGF